MSYTDILYDEKNQTATIAINRPAKLNAFTGHTLHEMEDAFNRAAGSSDIGVIVLTGVGDKAFCAGGDLNWGKEDGAVENFEFKMNALVLNCAKPVIARVNGYAIGSGNHMAYFCDFTIAAEHAIFGQNGPRVGSPAAGHYVSYSAQILGQKRAREMWMLCRRYPASQMLQWGLINAVVPYDKLDAEVERWCSELLAMSPTCLKILKRSFNRLVDLTPMKDVVEEVAPGYYRTGEMQEGMTAFLEKRRPDFAPWR